MEWDSKEEIKAGKEGVHDRSEFHQEVSILNLNKSQNNLELLCTAVVVPGAHFSKVPIINEPGNLLPFTLKIEFSIVLHIT